MLFIWVLSELVFETEWNLKLLFGSMDFSVSTANISALKCYAIHSVDAVRTWISPKSRQTVRWIRMNLAIGMLGNCIRFLRILLYHIAYVFRKVFHREAAINSL
jgi:hypothetical protein